MDLYEVGRITGIMLFVYLIMVVIPDSAKNGLIEIRCLLISVKT